MAKLIQKNEIENSTNSAISSNVSRERKNPFDKRAKRKFINRRIAAPLIALNSKSKKQYIKQYWCENAYLWDYNKERYTSKLCKTRLCTGCQNIKTAELIAKFETTLKTEIDLYFLTLTVVNPTPEELKGMIKHMKKTWRKITDLALKQHIELHGLIKLEITYNENENTYHPHFHILITGIKEAEFIQKHWLRLNPTSTEINQPIEKADENSIKELLKYVTKVFKKDKNDKNKYNVNIKAIDFINENLKGVRTFEAFGKFRNLPEPEFTPEEIKSAYYGDSFLWQQKISTWEARDGTTLSDNNYSDVIKINFK